MRCLIQRNQATSKTISVAAIFIATVYTSCGCSYLSGQPEHTTITTSVDKIHSKDLRRYYDLAVSCSLMHTPVYDFDDHEISDVVVRVVRHDLEYQGPPVLYELKLSRKWKWRDSTTDPPLWSNTHRLSSEIILPSGRFFRGPGGGVYLILFDGEACSLLKLDESKNSFVEAQKTPELEKEIKEVYATSFALDDIYWNYALVQDAGFFIKSAAEFEPSKFIDSKELYQHWEKNLEAGTK